MGYLEFNPSKNLEKIIDKFWISENHQSEHEIRVLPDCSMDILFNLGNTYLPSSKSKIKNSEIVITGMMTNFSDVFSEKGAKIFGVRFKPLGLNYFLSFNFGSIKNDIVRINELISNFYYEELRKIFLCTSVWEMAEFFEKFMLNRISSGKKIIYPEVEKILENIVISKNNDVNEVVKDIFKSRRMLEIKFKEIVGTGIKEFININRFKEVHKEILASKKSFSWIAQEHGYYDSAHFIKEFRKYTGHSPKFFR